MPIIVVPPRPGPIIISVGPEGPHIDSIVEMESLPSCDLATGVLVSNVVAMESTPDSFAIAGRIEADAVDGESLPASVEAVFNGTTTGTTIISTVDGESTCDTNAIAGHAEVALGLGNESTPDSFETRGRPELSTGVPMESTPAGAEGATNALVFLTGATLPTLTVGVHTVIQLQLVGAGVSTSPFNEVEITADDPDGLGAIGIIVSGRSLICDPIGPLSAVSFVLRANAPGLTEAVKTFSIAVVEGVPSGGPLSISTPAALPPASAGNHYLVSLQASGGTPPYSWVGISGTAPPGVLVPPISLLAAGTLVGDPQASDAGDYTAVIEVHDSLGNVAQQEFTLHVGAAGIIVFTNTTNIIPPIAPGVPMTPFQVTYSGNTAPVTLTIETDLIGVGISSKTAFISGTPRGEPMQYAIKVKALNGVDDDAETTFFVELLAVSPLILTTQVDGESLPDSIDVRARLEATTVEMESLPSCTVTNGGSVATGTQIVSTVAMESGCAGTEVMVPPAGTAAVTHFIGFADGYLLTIHEGDDYTWTGIGGPPSTIGSIAVGSINFPNGTPGIKIDARRGISTP